MEREAVPDYEKNDLGREIWQSKWLDKERGAVRRPGRTRSEVVHFLNYGRFGCCPFERRSPLILFGRRPPLTVGWGNAPGLAPRASLFWPKAPFMRAEVVR